MMSLVFISTAYSADNSPRNPDMTEVMKDDGLVVGGDIYVNELTLNTSARNPDMTEVMKDDGLVVGGDIYANELTLNTSARNPDMTKVMIG